MLYGFQIAGTLPDLTTLPNFLCEEGAAVDGGAVSRLQPPHLR